MGARIERKRSQKRQATRVALETTEPYDLGVIRENHTVIREPRISRLRSVSHRKNQLGKLC
jgi:hypothetical protein